MATYQKLHEFSRNLPTGAGGQPGGINYLTRVMAKMGTQWKRALAQSTDMQPPDAPTGPEPAALPSWNEASCGGHVDVATACAVSKCQSEGPDCAPAGCAL